MKLALVQMNMKTDIQKILTKVCNTVTKQRCGSGHSSNSEYESRTNGDV